MSSSEGARVISTKSVIIALVSLAIIVGGVLFVFRYEYVGRVNTELKLTYIERINRFTHDRCVMLSDLEVELLETWLFDRLERCDRKDLLKSKSVTSNPKTTQSYGERFWYGALAAAVLVIAVYMWTYLRKTRRWNVAPTILAIVVWVLFVVPLLLTIYGTLT